MHRLALIALFSPVVCQAQTADPAVARVQAYGVGVARVAGAGLSLKAREQKFLPIVREAYDLTGSLALIAGPAWARASAGERTAAVDALARRSAAEHAANFKAPLAIKVDPTPKARGTDRLVRADIGDETLIYRMRQSGGQWRILDVTARGVSQLALQRSDLASTVAAGGVEALTRKLNELSARTK